MNPDEGLWFYAVLYNLEDDLYSIIEKAPGSKSWTVKVEGIRTEADAEEIAVALNEKETRDREQ